MPKDVDTSRQWRILLLSGPSDGDAGARPTAQQLKTGNAKTAGNFIEISQNMVLDVLWRQRLGQLYMEKISPQDYDKHSFWVLEKLPENYQLYAQMRPNCEPIQTTNKVDGHFFGLKVGNTNADFQSPEEFLPHLIWLGSGRNDPCLCSHCNKPPKTKSAAGSSIKRVALVPPVQAPVEQSIAPPVVPRAPSIPSLQSYLPLMHIDSLPSSGIYRPGELVWANPNDTYPVISVIANRKLVGPELKYELLPLKSPRVPSRTPLVLSQERIRPWLSYTPPNPLLPSLASRKYEVRWESINWQDWTHQDSEIHDASIIASIQIACTIAVPQTSDGLIPYIWVGGEKIWRNGEVRVLTQEVDGQKGMDVLVIKNIAQDTNGTIQLQGNVYCKVLHIQQKDPYPDPPPTGRMMAEASALPCSWYLKYQNVQVNAMETKGRWYPTYILRPIICPPDLANQMFYDIGGLLNGSGDIPSQAGGWRTGVTRDASILGIGYLSNDQPAGWINVDDWYKLFTDDTAQMNELMLVSEPAQIATKPQATRKSQPRKAVVKKSTNVGAVVASPLEKTLEPQEGVQLVDEHGDNRIILDDDDQDEFLRQIEQDGANFEKSVQEGDLWGFF